MGLRKSDVAADWKDSVRFVIDGSGLPVYTRNGNVIMRTGNGALPAQDGVTPVVGDSAAVDFASPHLDSGIYRVTQVGSASLPFVLTRRDDFKAGVAVTAGIRFSVEEGTIFGGEEVRLATVDPIEVNVTPLDFELVEAGGGGVGGFTQIDAGETKTIAAKGALVLTKKVRIEGRLKVLGNLKFVESRRPVILPVVYGPRFVQVPNNCIVPVDTTAGDVDIELPDAGRPGDSVVIQNINGAGFIEIEAEEGANERVIFNGTPGGDGEVIMSSVGESARFTRLNDQNWLQEI